MQPPPSKDGRYGSHVFVSYQGADRALAEAIADAVSRSGHSVFIDSKIRVGDLWDETLEAALAAAYAVLVLWTQNATQSRWVRTEARFALQHQRYCPALLHPCDLPLEFSSIDAANLVGWDPTDTASREWRLLVDALNLCRGRRLVRLPDAEATVFLRLGLKYLDGDGAPKNTALALVWLRRAHDAGHPDAAPAIAEIEDQS